MTVGNPSINDAYSYPDYRMHLDELVKRGQTTGNTQNEKLTEFTRLNITRMSRIDKTFLLMPALSDAIKNIKSNQVWKVITEGWCGDSAQSVPVLNAIALASQGMITLALYLRDDNPGFMNAHLTGESRSIPKLVSFADTGNQLFSWGPRPLPAQEIMLKWKANREESWESFEISLHTWYAHDKGETLQAELAQLLNQGIPAPPEEP